MMPLTIWTAVIAASVAAIPIRIVCAAEPLTLTESKNFVISSRPFVMAGVLSQTSTEDITDLDLELLKRIDDGCHLRICILRHALRHTAVLLVNDAKQCVERFGSTRESKVPFLSNVIPWPPGKILFRQAEHRERFTVRHYALIQLTHHVDERLEVFLVNTRCGN